MKNVVSLTRSEADLMVRQMANMVWVVLILAATALLAFLPAARRASDQLGGSSLVEIYHPLMIVVIVLLLSLTVLPEDIAGYRESHYLKRLRATPAGPAEVLAARAVVTVALEAIAIVGIVVLPVLSGAATGMAVLPLIVAIAVTVIGLLGVGFLVAGAAPNRKVGMALGLVLFVLLAFAAGLWYPREDMPSWMQRATEVLPTGPIADALETAMAGSMPSAQHLLIPLAWGVIAAALSVKIFRWE